MQSQCLGASVRARYLAAMSPSPADDAKSATRLSDVESLMTFMQRTIDDLNQVVLEQARRIERQEAALARLRASLETLIGSIVETPRRPEDERPPHY
jgi:uncharacterized coiled-coil protein SlyX